MKNMYKFKYEYAIYQEQGGFILPILEVRGCGFDWNRSLVTLASLWDRSFALKHPAIQFTVLKFLVKNAKFVCDSERSFLVPLIRFALCLYV